MTGPDRAISRRQLELFTQCPRCFWLFRRHEIKQPEGYPLALNNAMDRLLKEEFDEYRARGELHPVLGEHFVAAADGSVPSRPAGPVKAKPFSDLGLLRRWRNNREGIRWSDPLTGYTLCGAADDVLEFPDGSLAVLDYKSSGASQLTVYDSYRLQLDTYTFLLTREGHRTAPHAFLAFFVAVKDDGFRGRLPFKGTVVAVPAQAERVGELFREAVILAESAEMPAPGDECEPCRWLGEVDGALGSRSGGLGAGSKPPAARRGPS